VPQINKAAADFPDTKGMISSVNRGIRRFRIESAQISSLNPMMIAIGCYSFPDNSVQLVWAKPCEDISEGVFSIIGVLLGLVIFNEHFHHHDGLGIVAWEG
jgi:hypothetical protein